MTFLRTVLTVFITALLFVSMDKHAITWGADNDRLNIACQNALSNSDILAKTTLGLRALLERNALPNSVVLIATYDLLNTMEFAGAQVKSVRGGYPFNMIQVTGLGENLPKFLQLGGILWAGLVPNNAAFNRISAPRPPVPGKSWHPSMAAKLFEEIFGQLYSQILGWQLVERTPETAFLEVYVPNEEVAYRLPRTFDGLVVKPVITPLTEPESPIGALVGDTEQLLTFVTSTDYPKLLTQLRPKLAKLGVRLHPVDPTLLGCGFVTVSGAHAAIDEAKKLSEVRNISAVRRFFTQNYNLPTPSHQPEQFSRVFSTQARQVLNPAENTDHFEFSAEVSSITNDQLKHKIEALIKDGFTLLSHENNRITGSAT